MDNIRNKFKKYAELQRDVLDPTELERRKLEIEIGNLLLTKYPRLVDKLLIEEIPEVKAGLVDKEKITIDPAYLEILGCRYNNLDLSLSFFTFKFRYWVGDGTTSKELTIKSRLALRFFSNYVTNKNYENEETID